MEAAPRGWPSSPRTETLDRGSVGENDDPNPWRADASVKALWLNVERFANFKDVARQSTGNANAECGMRNAEHKTYQVRILHFAFCILHFALPIAILSRRVFR
jgi:hypothetical protein